MYTRYRFSLTLAAGFCAVAIITGCSRHDDTPATPVDTAKTPTFRSSANSYDQPNTPMYTQPGINHGKPIMLPPLPKVDRSDQNAPLAQAVYAQLQDKLGVTAIRYITAQTDGTTITLGGSATSKEVVAEAGAIAKQTKGVTAVKNQIEILAR